MNDTTQQPQDDNQQQVQTMNAAGQEYEIIGGVACPIDPFEREMCDSCQ